MTVGESPDVSAYSDSPAASMASAPWRKNSILPTFISRSVERKGPAVPGPFVRQSRSLAQEPGGEPETLFTVAQIAVVVAG